MPNRVAGILVMILGVLVFEQASLANREHHVLAPRGADEDLLDRMAGVAQERAEARKITAEPGGKPLAIMDSDFKIGGVNTTQSIRALTSINGIPISYLENSMRPGRLSDMGFLGTDESLIEVLAQDNDFVLGVGLSHQQLAEPLSIATRRDEFKFNGQSFFVISVMASHDAQVSPFDHRVKAKANRTIRCLKTGQELSFADLVPEFIGSYGFYEGHGTGYRVEPGAIIRMFFPHHASSLPKELPQKTMSVEEINRILETTPIPKKLDIAVETFDGITSLIIRSESSKQIWSYPNVVQLMGDGDRLFLVEYLDPADHQPRYIVLMDMGETYKESKQNKLGFENWKGNITRKSALLRSLQDNIDADRYSETML